MNHVRKWEMVVVAIILGVTAALCALIWVPHARGGEPQLYTRSTYSSGGYYSYDYYGRPHYYPPTYSYSYTPYVRPVVVVPKPPAYSSDWQTEMLRYARARDDYQSYLLALKALGHQGQQYEFQHGYPSTYSYPAVGNYGATGNSLYGYTYQQVQQSYGDVNLNTLYQQSARLAQNGQNLGSQATSEFAQLVERAGANQARVAEILAQAKAAEMALNAAKPQANTTTTTTIQRQDFRPGTAKGAGDKEDREEAQAAQEVKQWLADVAVPRCAGCHSGKDAKGGFSIHKYPEMPVEQKKKVLERLVSTDPDKRMPRKGAPEDSKPGEPLPEEEIRSFVTGRSPKK